MGLTGLGLRGHYLRDWVAPSRVSCWEMRKSPEGLRVDIAAGEQSTGRNVWEKVERRRLQKGKRQALGISVSLRITWWESGSRGAGKTGSVAKPW